MRTSAGGSPVTVANLHSDEAPISRPTSGDVLNPFSAVGPLRLPEIGSELGGAQSGATSGRIGTDPGHWSLVDAAR